MLRKKYRFHSRGGVKYTYKNGHTIRGPWLSLIYNDNSRGFQRFAVVVSKKVAKSAVTRNRIRRRIYEAIRAELPAYAMKRDHIFVAYSKDLLACDFAKLQKLIHRLIKESATR